MLQQTNYLNDPRKSIADFYHMGNQRGHLGSLPGRLLAPGSGSTSWSAVYKPTNKDALAKMLTARPRARASM